MHDSIQYQGGTSLLVSNFFYRIPPLNVRSPQEPLDVLPDLLRCFRQEAVDLIYLIAENSSAKEVLIVIQETLEQLTQLSRENEDDDERVSGAILCLINVIAASTKCEFYTSIGR